MSKKNNLLVYILAVGVFGILNTEMGFIGILPFIAEQFRVDIVEAGLLISLFALGVAIAGPTMPLLFSGMNRKRAMLMVLGIFFVGNIVSIFATNFMILLIARVIPAFFHPIYCSMAFSIAAASAALGEAPKAVAKIVVGVSAGMVIGVPISNFIAGMFSLKLALSFFAIVNLLVLIATFFFVPSLPVKQSLSYGEQLNVLKKPMVLTAILAVVFMNGAVFGVFNYLAEYLGRVTGMNLAATSGLLFIYGVMNIFGSLLAGEMLTQNAFLTIRWFMIFLFGTYCFFFWGGNFWLPMVGIILFWGILGGINANVTQYLISQAAPEAPDFANGLFLTAANLGTTLGTFAGGFFIAKLGTYYVVFAGVLFVVLAWFVIFIQFHYLVEKSAEKIESGKKYLI